MITANALSPEARSISLMRALGWQGGTIHQVARETGCNSSDLLHGTVSDSRAEGRGFAAARTCSLDFNRSVNFPAHRGDLSFWLGAAFGQYLHDNGVPSFAKDS